MQNNVHRNTLKHNLVDRKELLLLEQLWAWADSGQYIHPTSQPLLVVNIKNMKADLKMLLSSVKIVETQCSLNNAQSVDNLGDLYKTIHQYRGHRLAKWYAELAQFLFMKGKTSPLSFHQNLSRTGTKTGIQQKQKQTTLLIKKNFKKTQKNKNPMFHTLRRVLR